MFNLVILILYLMQPIKPEIIEPLPLSDALEDSTPYNYMASEPLFPIVGSVFMRRVGGVSDPLATITNGINGIIEQDIAKPFNESEMPNNVLDKASTVNPDVALTINPNTDNNNLTIDLDLTSTSTPSTVVTIPTADFDLISTITTSTHASNPMIMNDLELDSKITPSTLSTNPTIDLHRTSAINLRTERTIIYMSFPPAINRFAHPYKLSSTISKTPILDIPMDNTFQDHEKVAQEILRVQPSVQYPPIQNATKLEQYQKTLEQILRARPSVGYQRIPTTTKLEQYEKNLEVILRSRPSVRYPPIPTTTKVPGHEKTLQEILRARASVQYPALQTATKLEQHHEKTLEEILRMGPPVQYPVVNDKPILRVHRPEHSLGVQDDGTEPFSIFFRKLLQILSSKSIVDLRKLIKHFEIYVTTLVDSGKLMKLGPSISSYIAQEITQLHLPTDEIRSKCAKTIIGHVWPEPTGQFNVGQMSLEYRRQMLPEAVNAMLDDMDDVYDVSEEEAMQRVLQEVIMFPYAGKTGERIVKDFVHDVFVHPMHRIAGTARGKTIFDSISKIAKKYSIPYNDARRFELNKYEKSKIKETSGRVNVDFKSTTHKHSKSNEYAARAFDSRNKRVKECNEGSKSIDLSSAGDDSREPRWRKRNIDKGGKLVIPISVSKNMRVTRRNNSQDENTFSFSTNDDNETDDSDNDIAIEVIIKNGRYAANRINKKYNSQKNAANNLNSRKLNKKEPMPLTSDEAGSDLSKRRKVISRKVNEDTSKWDETNEDRLSLLGTNKERRGGIARKNKYGEKKRVYFDYNDLKKSSNVNLGNNNKKYDINVKTIDGRRKNKIPKIEYDCKRLPIVNDKSNNETHSQLLIYCDQASTVT